MKPSVQVTLGFVAAAALLWAAVWLWTHNWIVIAAPVGALALGAAWVGVDNAIIYPAQRAQRDAALADETETTTAVHPAGLPVSASADDTVAAVPGAASMPTDTPGPSGLSVPR